MTHPSPTGQARKDLPQGVFLRLSCKGDGLSMIVLEQLGARIAALRRAKGLTQEMLAEKMGVSPQAVSKWERGLAFPNPVWLDELADILDTSIDSLLTGRVPKNEKD
ncbi:MAG: helix-turn-helix transcriptional regulator [Ruminococcaceae bacterium]|nr:helix-turn-helix transcriptional regulator [Oscillospiraceae bacterium]